MQSTRQVIDFSEPQHMSDAVLLVEGEKFHVHRSILSMCSTVFEKMFSEDFAEEKNQETIQLPGKKASEIRELLLVIYPHSKQVDESNFLFLLSLADEYQMAQLKQRCENFLLWRQKSKCQSVYFLVLAQRFGLESLRKHCIEMAKDMPLSKLKSHEMYQYICPEIGQELAERRLEHFESSYTLGVTTLRSTID